MLKLNFLIVIALLLLSTCQTDPLPEPDLANVKYGPYKRNSLDIWFADTIETTPLTIFIHGGGFEEGDKEDMPNEFLQPLMESGISVASINYRLHSDALLPAAFYDSKRALQFIRSNSKEWGIDKEKIAVFGGSAGAQIGMWLAFADEMANPDAEDPVEHESSRLHCLATWKGQTTMDFDLWVEWVPGLEKMPYTKEQIFGPMTDEEYREIIESLSPISIISTDDPPIYMDYPMKPDDPIPSNPLKAWSWQVHHVVFGIKLKEKMDELGVESYLLYPGADSEYESCFDFIKSKLH
jgi:acetyl esterase